ncbi:hypothetical protein VNO77_04341 [Canavalia gladiata]|uniref:Uncharacterized protein n=1 Tax=Canavalia gladiata TaxID=3824 RepID=A0AAN9N1G2_CANGL
MESLIRSEGQVVTGMNRINTLLRETGFVVIVDGLPDIVVWNPWKKSKSIADFGDEEYKQMLCVDGVAIEQPITLEPVEMLLLLTLTGVVFKARFHLNCINIIARALLGGTGFVGKLLFLQCD